MHLNGEISLQTDGIVDQSKNNYGNRKKIKSQMNKNIRTADLLASTASGTLW